MTSDASFEYVVIGSGPGGGTLAARLADAGRRVLLLEAGSDPRESSGGDAISPSENRLPEDYDVPAFHAFSSENDAMAWHFFVKHHRDGAQDRLDPNFVETFHGRRVDGFYYPRAGTLGGCSAHNAMIFVYPSNADWDAIAEHTGDSTWSASHMRRYFELLENCRHRPVHRWLAKLGFNPSRHGWNGWLSTETYVPRAVLKNDRLDTLIVDAVKQAFREDCQQLSPPFALLRFGLDPNDWRLVKDNATGVRIVPITTDHHARVGTRERVLDAHRRHPDRLSIRTNALATRILFDDTQRAIGVEYQRGARLYRAHADASSAPGPIEQVHVSREVILAGGAFNSPQLLMLSGIGPEDQLRRHMVPVRVHLNGVGRNLQDRYEVGVVNRMNFPAWSINDGATFGKGDPLFDEWTNRRTGAYATNGSVLTVFRRSPHAGIAPDLFCMALLVRFEGYKPGYSKTFATDLNYLTWVVLKAHNANRAGTVRLQSADPRDTPVISFNQFDDGGAHDVEAMVDGLKFVRRLTEKLNVQGLIDAETVPGPARQTDAELADFIRTHAWGHHACGTCAIGSIDEDGVLSSDFRVHGTRGLRVVDASVFPRIPGFFIVSAVYMIAEKAADVILGDAQ